MADNSRAKNELQEFLQQRGHRLPLYSEEAREGLYFKAKVSLDWQGMQLSCYGLALKKKDAEKAAAANMLVKIRKLERKPKTTCTTTTVLVRETTSSASTGPRKEKRERVKQRTGSGLSGCEQGKVVASVPSQNPQNPAYPPPANPPAYQQAPPQYSPYPPQPQYPPQPGQYPAQCPPPQPQYPAQYPPPQPQYPPAQYQPQQPGYAYGAPAGATAPLPSQMAGMTLQDRPRAGDTPLLSMFTQGNIVILESRARASQSTTNSLRIDKDGFVNAHGINGVYAQFTVHVRRPGVIALQNVSDPTRWLAIYQGKTIGTGKGGPYCELAVGEVERGQYVVLESIMHPGYHIGILPSGESKDPDKTGVGNHAQFRPRLPATSPLLSLFAEGNVLILQSVASGKSLRITQGGIVDGNGERGQYAQLRVHVRGVQTVALQSVGTGHYLAIKNGMTTFGTGGQFCNLIVKEVAPGCVSLESVEHRSQHVGILPDGCVKAPHGTGTGQHGQYTVSVHSYAPPQPAPAPAPAPVPTRAGDTPLLSLFAEGSVLILESRASGKSLRITQGGIVDGNGGRGQYAQLRVHVRGAQTVALQSVGTGNYLAIKNGMTTFGTGGQFCNLIVKEVAPGYVSLESVEHRSQHVGILPDGCVKAPHATGTGQHGQYSVTVYSASQAAPPKHVPKQPAHPPRPYYLPRAGDTALLALFTEGNVVFLQSRASGKSLRINSGGYVDGMGGSGQYAQFLVHVRRAGVVALESMGTRKYLAIRDTQTTTGTGGKFCDLIVKEIDASHVALESVESRGQHVGVRPDGCVKPPNHTGTGHHGQFRVSVHSYAPAPARSSHGTINLFGMKIQFGKV